MIDSLSIKSSMSILIEGTCEGGRARSSRVEFLFFRRPFIYFFLFFLKKKVPKGSKTVLSSFLRRTNACIWCLKSQMAALQRFRSIRAATAHGEARTWGGAYEERSYESGIKKSQINLFGRYEYVYSRVRGWWRGVIRFSTGSVWSVNNISPEHDSLLIACSSCFRHRNTRALWV